MAIKDVHQPAELGQAAAQAVDLVDDHDGNESRRDVGQQMLKGWALEGRARKACVGVQARRGRGGGQDRGLTWRLGSVQVRVAGVPLGLDGGVD